MNNKDLTIAICAYNAAATIERAILSALPEVDCPLLLVDDASTDDTVARAQAIGGSRLTILRSDKNGGIACARQKALDALQTPLAAWLDADDEWIPGRAARLTQALNDFDIATDPIELYDGPTGKFLRLMNSPPFLHNKTTPARLFERNYLSGDTQVGFRVEIFRQAGGYDTSRTVDGPESYDLLLRAILKGARFHYGKTAGYKMYAYPGSISRQLDKQRAATTIVLRKHPYDTVRKLCLSLGESPRVTGWILTSMALYRNEPQQALAFIDEASPADADPHQILEADGPLPVSEGWRRAFQRGTVLLLIGQRDAEALKELEKAYSYEACAEGANNLGVALARLGKVAEAKEYFARSQELFPGYLDAKLNQESAQPTRITTHPLRRQASRSEYAANSLKK